MGQRLPLALGKKSNRAQAPQESVERVLNGYLEQVTDGKEPDPIYGTPGLVLWCGGLGGAIRGGIEMGGVPYVVAGTTLYSIDGSGVSTILGMVPGTDTVSMASDGTNVVIVSTGLIYVWNGSVVQVVTDPDAPLASFVVWIDSFFLFGELNTQVFFISALADPTNFDALDFASAEWQPDLLTAGLVLRSTVHLFGPKTVEAQQDTGGADFPFTPYPDVQINVGIAGRDAGTTTNDSMFWLANDGTIRRLDGLTAAKVSTTAIGALIKAWSDKTATVASAHVWAEHLFVVFWNPDGCVVYDQNTDRWHERASYQSATWQARHYIEAYGLQLFCSATEGKIFKLASDAYDEDGATLEFEVVTPYAYAGNKLLTVNDFEVVAQMGVGTLTLDPQLTIERTTDGQTFGLRRARRLGKQGQRDGRLTFGPQGQARAMAWRIRITDPVQRAILGAYADVDVEP